MIKPYNGAKAAKFVSREPLPRGGYVLKIISAKTEDYDWGQVLILAIDVCEGEHKGFFERDFKANTNEDKKWRGTYRINVPNEGSQYFETQQKSFNNFIACLEESNSGYHWGWDESELKGKLIGGLWRNKEWEMNGKTGWTTECCSVTDIASIREGNFKLPADKPLANKVVSNGIFDAIQGSGVETSGEVSEDDLPF